MTGPRQVSFDAYLDIVFGLPNWSEGCVTMLSVFLEDIDSTRENPTERLPDVAPSIIEQVVAMAKRAQRLVQDLRDGAQTRGPDYQTPELGAVLWWAGMAVHKALASAETANDMMAQAKWEDAFFETHLLLFETMSAISLLTVAEAMFQRMETGDIERERPN